MTTSSVDKVLPEARSRVCVIGAGAAGLAAGRLLRDEGCDVTVLEKSLHVGGVWRYNPEPREKAPMCESSVFMRTVARTTYLNLMGQNPTLMMQHFKTTWRL